MENTSVSDKVGTTSHSVFLPATDLVALKDTSRDFSKNFIPLMVIDLVKTPDNSMPCSLWCVPSNKCAYLILI